MSVLVRREFFEIIEDNDGGRAACMIFSEPTSEEELDYWVHSLCRKSECVASRGYDADVDE